MTQAVWGCAALVCAQELRLRVFCNFSPISQFKMPSELKNCNALVVSHVYNLTATVISRNGRKLRWKAQPRYLTVVLRAAFFLTKQHSIAKRTSKFYHYRNQTLALAHPFELNPGMTSRYYCVMLSAKSAKQTSYHSTAMKTGSNKYHTHIYYQMVSSPTNVLFIWWW